ncbi:uncharacterized protein LOC143911448 [Arctopsyche grandis]|uniref:uncharacterized protein LOC143911448 n=1 Tax=Arctopsyche grandis TaxID=121162 RepID=UPI00406D9A2E
MDEVRCYLRRENGTFTDFTDGLVDRSGLLKDMEFFYLSANDKLTHLSYDRALDALKCNINSAKLKIYQQRKNHHRSSATSKSPPHPLTSFESKTHSNSKQQTIARKRSSTQMLLDSSDDSEAEVPQSPKRQMCPKDCILDAGNNGNLKKSPIKNNIQDNDSSSTFLSSDCEKQTNVDNGNSCYSRKNGDNLSSGLNNKYSDKTPPMSSDSLKLIKKWFYKNNNCVVTLICNENEEVFHNVLNALNPVVRIEHSNNLNNLVEKANNYTKKDFMHSLGLESHATQNVEKIDTTKILNAGNSKPKVLSNSNKKEPNQSNKPSDPFTVLKGWTFKKKPMLNHNKILQKPSAEPTTSNSHSPKRLPGKNVPISRNYSIDEDMCIIDWILKNNHTHLVNGNNVWKKFEASNEMITGRTWQSMRNRFLKVILFRLRDYSLSNDDEMRIKKGVHKGCIKHSENFGWVIDKKATKELPKGKKQILPLRLTFKKIPATNKPPDNLTDYHHYSDSDVLLDDSVQWAFEKKQPKRRLFTNQSYVGTSSSSCQ